MAPAQDAAGLLYDPADPRYRIDPYPLYARLREADPVHWSPLGFWVLTRYADVDCVHRDPRCGRGLQPDDGMVATWGGPSSPITAELGGWMLHKDGPDHTRLRRLVGKVFHPAAVRSLRMRIQGIVDGLLDQVVEAGTMDVIADLALPLPVAVISELLGLPVDDHARIGRWADSIARAFDDVLTPEALERTEAAILQCTEYVRTKIAVVGGAESGILSALRAAEASDQLSESELISNVNLLLFAGFETTRNLIGNGFFALLRNPTQLARLRAEPGLVPNAIMELLRYDAPVQANRRIPREPIEVGGVEIPAGEKLLLLLGAANRDPARFVDPDSLNVARPDVRPLSFGGGVHFCLGAGLAVTEAEIAVSSLIERLADVDLAGPVEWGENIFLRGVTALPISFTPGRSHVSDSREANSVVVHGLS